MAGKKPNTDTELTHLYSANVRLEYHNLHSNEIHVFGQEGESQTHQSPNSISNLLLLPAPNTKDVLYQKTGTGFQSTVTILITDP